MGTVWRAWDARTQQMVAAKVLRQSDAATLLRFVREQSVRIHHPHVVVPLSWAGEDDRVLFTMALVTGGSVATLVQDFGALPPLLVAEILRQLLAGLAAVHDAGLVHRDIKPANLLLDPTGTGRPHVWLSDFGISVDLNRPRWTETGVVSGTPGYLAPELERFGEVTPAVDLYAVGQVGLTMLLGARPAQRRGQPLAAEVRPEQTPATLWSGLAALIADDPASRPADARTALAMLGVPELAWRADALGDVEVFQHIASPNAPNQPPPVEPPAHQPRPEEPPADQLQGAPGRVDRDPVLAPRAPEPVPAAEQATPTLPEDEPTVRRAPDPQPAPDSGDQPSSSRPWLVWGALVGLPLVGLVLIWSPWSGGVAETPRPPITSTTPATTTSTTSTTGEATPTRNTGSTGATPGSDPTQGSVSVGTVVTRVGQPCEFSEVGVTETTVGGTPVVCAQQPGGSYVWSAR